MKTARLLITLLCLAAVGCAVPKSDIEAPPSFGLDDQILCSTGGGEGISDKFIFKGDGTVTYTSLEGKTSEATLTAEETDKLYQELVDAGLLSLIDVPNREMEQFGIYIETQLGGVQKRASIGVLEIEQKKHRSWQYVMSILARQTEQVRENES